MMNHSSMFSGPQLRHTTQTVTSLRARIHPVRSNEIINFISNIAHSITSVGGRDEISVKRYLKTLI